MIWQVIFHDDFRQEFNSWAPALQDELLVQTDSLEQEGPNLGRPLVDTLKGSRYPNMKE